VIRQEPCVGLEKPSYMPTFEDLSVLSEPYERGCQGKISPLIGLIELFRSVYVFAKLPYNRPSVEVLMT
jgi:hypothetical protein